MVAAALGGEFEVPTINGGNTRVKVPEGTQSGRRFRLQGKGMPVLRSKQTGDMYVQVVVETPQKLTKRQRELLAEFERLSSKETHPEIRRILRQSQGVPGSRRLRLTNCRLTPGRSGLTGGVSRNLRIDCAALALTCRFPPCKCSKGNSKSRGAFSS